jgi:DNA-binding response OmpR family regulator
MSVSENTRLLAGMRCLVVEDEFLIALDLQEIFEAAGAAAVTCLANAEAVLAALREEKFNLAILDINLGGATRTSFSVAEALTAQKTPFVFLTGMRRDATMTSGFEHVPLLEKPYQQETVLEAIRNVLDLK